MKQLFTLNKYFIKYKKYFLGGILFVLLSNLFSVMAPQITGHMVNKVQQYLNPNIVTKPKQYNFFVAHIVKFIDGFGNTFIVTIAWFSIVIILLALLRGLFMYFMRQTLIVISRHIEYDQKNDIYKKYQALNQTPANWTKREIMDGILYQLKNGCNWEDLPKDLPPYSTVFWHYKQWRAAGVFEQLMTILHGQVREQVKKKLNGPD